MPGFNHIWNQIDKFLIPDGKVTESSLIQLAKCKSSSFTAILAVTINANDASAARLIQLIAMAVKNEGVYHT